MAAGVWRRVCAAQCADFLRSFDKWAVNSQQQEKKNETGQNATRILKNPHAFESRNDMWRLKGHSWGISINTHRAFNWADQPRRINGESPGIHASPASSSLCDNWTKCTSVDMKGMIESTTWKGTRLSTSKRNGHYFRTNMSRIAQSSLIGPKPAPSLENRPQELPRIPQWYSTPAPATIVPSVNMQISCAKKLPIARSRNHLFQESSLEPTRFESFLRISEEEYKNIKKEI